VSGLTPRSLVPLAIAAVVALLPLALAGGLLATLPLLLLLVPLVCGRYPGEGTLERLRASKRRRPAVASSPLPALPLRAMLGGGLLIARSLAGRAPPAISSA
jgi:hypothetical protein